MEAILRQGLAALGLPDVDLPRVVEGKSVELGGSRVIKQTAITEPE